MLLGKETVVDVPVACIMRDIRGASCRNCFLGRPVGCWRGDIILSQTPSDQSECWNVTTAREEIVIKHTLQVRKECGTPREASTPSVWKPVHGIRCEGRNVDGRVPLVQEEFVGSPVPQILEDNRDHEVGPTIASAATTYR